MSPSKGRIRDVLSGFVDPLKVSPEREEEIIRSIVRFVSRWQMELPAITLIAPMAPVSNIVSYTTLLPIAPWLEFVGIPGFEYVAFFYKRENVDRLVRRLQELRKKRTGEGL